MNNCVYMNVAISLARATLGQTSPNPSVGAVLVKDGRLVGTGVHMKAGTPHAEVHAIRAAGNAAKGADMYVTLEPCSHHGKTPPCADLIIEAGIKKVFVATLDPNPLVAGKGIDKLTSAGIEVEVGLCKEEALQLNEKFFHFIQKNTPFVTIKAGISLDGKIAAKSGDSKWITSPESRQDVHQLRHEHDGILVGINTILQDNPLLTTRRPRGGKNPIRIVLDTELKIPVSANVVQDCPTQTIIFTGSQFNFNKKRELESLGVTIISQDSAEISLKGVLHTLGEREIISVLVEGGSEIHASFIEEEAFQQIITYVAPKIIGGREAIPFIGGAGPELVKLGKQLRFTAVEKIGPDIKITAKPLKEEETE
ncbi:diaminohydroxyphosphoribosylaminopyrimidine deaminase/5-amino-6-(5-phosphoribosylamino)uracil reductase [Cytobacillus eiseniae]|uniref:Riboflavin biosynthesis protein RibD n=1 Tax=Cytobacillus eiseniae TaxID=762947 RepID=A0ABS4RBT3_9BACI|nr:bifunctional diaminohydroxyphosphoribosylaminopyrimidine deaminase/5-amino-6-(5-phosphoribosylamino)uracil reductase RibD [Cytobacillus eiseniae]MBP2240361.1 diaminohydroxyphosphoribosylaminopyrimidine deaminase/5-amino-6-(5-phosphoribosylamino)uracil reductase [Cytobacillus eiseniae]